MSDAPASDRTRSVARALRLEVLTVGWNVIEAVVAITAARASGSVALLGFGLDSCVETASAVILIWRLRADARLGCGAARDRADRLASRLVAASLVLLALWVAGDATASLIAARGPEASPVGIGLTAVSLVVMTWLARAKRAEARVLGSGALEADAFQTTACAWLSAVTLGGLVVHAATGWWWVDPVAALGIAGLIAVEARDHWRGKACCA